jgi:apolipoprotein N-acyltransferase
MNTLASFRQHIFTGRAVAPTRQGADRLSWLWLVIGAALLAFTGWQTVIPLAAWLAPIFMLRFARTQRAFVALSILPIASCVATFVAWRNDFFGPPSLVPYIFIIIVGVLFSLGYIADRLLAPRLSGLLRTLVFPCAVTTVDFLNTLINPLAAGGSLAYSQPGQLPIQQIVAVSGMWGLTFLIAWSAAAVNTFWEAGFAWRPARASVLPVALVLLASVLFGSARLAFFPQSGPSVRVAALSPNEANFGPMEVGSHQLHPGTDAERADARPLYARNLDDLLARTQQAAHAGAKIVGWPENAVFALKEDEPAVIARMSALARAEGIYLVTGFRTSLQNEQLPFAENRTLIIDPTGMVVSDYHKTHIGPGDAFAAGPGIVPTIDTPYGRLAAMICVDADFPMTARQIGQARADILILPVDDWAQITQYHTDLLALRAIENGVAVIRPAVQGIARAYDAQGRVLGQADYFAGDNYLLLVDVPTHGVPTLYARIGDWFAYLCVAALGALAALALVRRSTIGATVPQVVGS